MLFEFGAIDLAYFYHILIGLASWVIELSYFYYMMIEFVAIE